MKYQYIITLVISIILCKQTKLEASLVPAIQTRTLNRIKPCFSGQITCNKSSCSSNATWECGPNEFCRAYFRPPAQSSQCFQRRRNHYRNCLAEKQRHNAIFCGRNPSAPYLACIDCVVHKSDYLSSLYATHLMKNQPLTAASSTHVPIQNTTLPTKTPKPTAQSHRISTTQIKQRQTSTKAPGSNLQTTTPSNTGRPCLTGKISCGLTADLSSCSSNSTWECGADEFCMTYFRPPAQSSQCFPKTTFQYQYCFAQKQRHNALYCGRNKAAPYIACINCVIRKGEFLSTLADVLSLTNQPAPTPPSLPSSNVNRSCFGRDVSSICGKLTSASVLELCLRHQSWACKADEYCSISSSGQDFVTTCNPKTNLTSCQQHVKNSGLTGCSLFGGNTKRCIACFETKTDVINALAALTP